MKWGWQLILHFLLGQIQLQINWQKDIAKQKLNSKNLNLSPIIITNQITVCNKNIAEKNKHFVHFNPYYCWCNYLIQSDECNFGFWIYTRNIIITGVKLLISSNLHLILWWNNVSMIDGNHHLEQMDKEERSGRSTDIDFYIQWSFRS